MRLATTGKYGEAASNTRNGLAVVGMGTAQANHDCRTVIGGRAVQSVEEERHIAECQDNCDGDHWEVEIPLVRGVDAGTSASCRLRRFCRPACRVSVLVNGIEVEDAR